MARPQNDAEATAASPNLDTSTPADRPTPPASADAPRAATDLLRTGVAKSDHVASNKEPTADSPAAAPASAHPSLAFLDEARARAAQRRANRERDRAAEAPVIDAARNGDQQAFQKLVVSHQGRLFAVAYGIVKDRDEAMDVVQDTFIKAHRKLAAFEGTAAFGTWLYRICVNLCIDRKRADARHRKVDVDDAMATVDGESLYGDADLAPRISGVNPLRNASSKQLGGELGRALDLLTDDHRVILLLREVDGMSYEEISAVLHVPRGTVMSRLHHARKHMQRILRPFLGLHDDTDLEGNLIVPEVNSNRGRKKKLPSDDDSPLAATAETDLEDQSAAERPDD